ERADLEATSQGVDLLTEVVVCASNVGDGGERHEELGGECVAPSFTCYVPSGTRLGIGHSGLAEGYMAQLVGDGEDLGCLRVGAIHEDQRGVGVAQGEAPELDGIQFSVC